MKFKYYFVLLLLQVLQIQGQDKFSKKDLYEDLAYLKKALIESQYDIYETVSQETFEKGFHHIKNKISKDSFNLLEATNILQQLPALVNNGHTSIDFPGSEYMKYANSGNATLFPLEIAFEGNKPLIRKNWSNNTDIKLGDEILSINNRSMNQILDQIYPQVSGESKLMKNSKIEMYSLPRYYWQIFGQVDTFNVRVKQNGKEKKYTIKAVPLMEGFENVRTRVLNAEMTLKFYDEIAYLNPGSFDGDLEKFKSFIKESFAKILNNKSNKLIIDLRNNSGGDNVFSDYMVSYIADKPFTWNSSFTLRTSKLLKETGLTKKNSSNYWKSIFSHTDGERYTYTFDKTLPQPKNLTFKGDVYVLVNRQSHSQATVTAAQIQDYNFGKIVGEETAEYPSLIASVFYFNLPKTGIKVQVSKGKMIRVNGSKKPEGVIPDIVIKDYLLDEEDEILNKLLQKLQL